MIIFLYGEDSYRSRQKLNEIIEQYQKIHKSGLNFKFFDGEEPNFSIDSLTNDFCQSSIFKEKKLFIVANLFFNTESKDFFREKLDIFADSENILIIYEKNEIKENDLLFRDLKKNKKIKKQEFKKISGPALKNLIKKEFENRKVEINSTALDLFFNYVGNDLWLISNEIEKLTNFKKRGRNSVLEKIKIEEKDIRLLVKPKIETDIFKTVDAIAQKNKKRTFYLLSKHLENGDSPLYLLSMISYQIRNLLIIKDLIEKNEPYNTIIKKSGLHPFVAKKSYFQSRYFALPELKKIYQKIFQVDLDVKTGKIEQETALDLLIAEI